MAKYKKPLISDKYENDDKFVRPKKTRKTRFFTGKYIPKNPSKYEGNPNDITFRSSWEYKFMSMIDADDNIIKWNSEGVIIPYYSVVDGKNRRYYMDFAITIRDHDGRINKFLIEIKPENQIYPPKKPKRLTEKSKVNYANAVSTYMVNINKWNAVIQHVKNQVNMDFYIVYYSTKDKEFHFLYANDVLKDVHHV